MSNTKLKNIIAHIDKFWNGLDHKDSDTISDRTRTINETRQGYGTKYRKIYNYVQLVQAPYLGSKLKESI